MDVVEEIRRDFAEFAERCLGVLLYGSHAKGESTKRSDIDVCIVKPEKGVFDRILGKLGGKYDLKVFEDLPLYVRADIIKNHIKIYAKDELHLYLYKQLRIWRDMEHRVIENSFSSVDEKLRNRRRWLNAKKKVLGEA